MMFVKRDSRRSYIALILVGISFLVLYKYSYNIILNIKYTLNDVEKLYSIVKMLIRGIFVISLFNGLYLGGSVLYFNKDIEFFLSLPIHYREILISKLLFVVSRIWLLLFIFTFPFFINYGIIMSMSIFYYITIFCFFITIPFIPVCLIMTLNIIFVRFLGTTVRHDIVKIISNIIFFIIVGFFLAGKVNLDEFISIESINQTIEINSNINFLAFLHINTQSFIGKILLIIIYNIVVFGCISIYLLIGQRYYVDSLYENRKRKIDNVKKKKNIRIYNIKKFPWITYTLKEIILILRTPEFFLNCFLINIVLPSIFLCVFRFKLESKNEILNMKLMMPIENRVTIFIVFLLIGFVSNKIAATALSREGHEIYFMKYIPLPYRVQFYSKILAGIILASISIPIYIYAFINYFDLKLIYLLGACIPSILGMYFIGYVGLYIDILNPHLLVHQKILLFKKNINILVHFIISILIIIFFVSIQFRLNLTLFGVYIYYYVVFLMLNSLAHVFLLKKCENIMHNLEI